MTERNPFPWGLYVFSQCLIILSMTVFSSKTSIWTRWLIFLPIAIISYYLVCYTTTGDVVVDLGLGSAIFTQLIVAIDYILIIDVQKEVHPKGQPPRSKGAHAEVSLATRFGQAFSLYCSPRGVGWSIEPLTLPKPSTKSRFAFVVSRIARALGCALLGAFASMAVNSNPALSGKTASVRDMGWFYHTTGVCAFALGAVTHISLLHSVLAVLCVGVGISRPQEWPDLFGSPFNAYSVQRFWGRTWHQMLRRPLKSCAIFVVTKILNCPIDKPYAPFVFFNIAFFISALVHVGGDYMMLGKPGTGAFWFFILQGLAVTLETVVSKLLSLPGSGLAARKPRNGALSTSRDSAALKFPPPMWTRVVGYVWVFSWFWWSLPFIVDPGILAGAYGPHRGMTFEQLSELVVNAYHQLAMDV